MLTPEEVDGLMAGLLISKDPPRGMTRLADWLRRNKDRVGAKYASEIKKHYLPGFVTET
jgi:NADH dehydrogenase